ncbi:MAG TPA: SirB2 family protein [Steroidobacteraceae bacterium]|jgi:uncharacterized membrane protein SirB2|nr:SirB2 family protein [Steroidobacteraceae bacterium]
MMVEWYLQLRHAHITLAIVSVTIFTVRGLLMLAQSRHVQSPWLKYTSYTVDTLLLTAALMLTTIIHQYPFQASWLTTKVALLVLYVVLGVVALKRGPTLAIRASAFVAALLTVGFLFTVARAHHPLGILTRFL